MKKHLLTLVISCLAMLAASIQSVSAQNKVFQKYADMDDVEYICITRSMLKLLPSTSATINGVHIDGITDALNIIIIANAQQPKARALMKADFATLRQNPDYETLMQMNSDGEKVVTLLNASDKVKEVVMYISNSDEQTFIVLTGTFTAEQLNKLLSGYSK